MRKIKDILAIQYDAVKELGKGSSDDAILQKVIKEVFNGINQEIEKGTDLSPYLSIECSATKKEYLIQLKLPFASDIFDSIVSDGKGYLAWD